MKRLPKILITIFLSIFILQMVCLIFLLAIPKETQAADDVKFNPQVSIPDSKFQRVECPQGMSEEDCEKLKYTITGKTIGEYIQAIYNYAIGIVGILAAVVLMFGGVIWLTAGGSQEKVKEAKAWIGASLSGLVLLLGSYMILSTINPDLVSFKEIAPPPISAMGCCEKMKDGGACSSSATEDKCESGWREGSSSCINNKCLTQGWVYTWEKTDDCSKLERINYGDNYCSDIKKPVDYNENDYRCCGKLINSDETQKATSPSEPAYNEDGTAKKFCCQADLDIVGGKDKSVCAFYQYSNTVGIGEKKQWIMDEEVCRNLPLLIDRVNRASQGTTARKTIVTFIEVSDTGGCEWNELEASGKCVVKE